MAAVLINGGDRLDWDVQTSYCRNLDARWRSPIADKSSKSGSLKFDAGGIQVQALWRCKACNRDTGVQVPIVYMELYSMAVAVWYMYHQDAGEA